jgi:hypothetical protein
MGEHARALDDAGVPLTPPGIIQFHLHVASGGTVANGVNRKSLGGWAGLIGGIALMAAFAGGYQFGHRSSPDGVSNLRPVAALGGFVPPGAAGPSAEAGLPAIERQLATTPQIIPPMRGATQAAPPPALPIPSSAPGAPTPARNAFGLEN